MDSSGPSLFPKGKIIGRKWKVIRKLGEGGCGSVFKVMNLTSNPTDPELAALKAERNSDISVLKLEIQVLQRLEGNPYVAQLIYSGKKDDVSYVIMTLMGDSLSNLLKKVGGRVHKSTLARVAINVLFCIKQVHEIGFVHRDLKPANIAIGDSATGRQHYLHVLDFGLSRMFAVQKGGRTVLRKPRDRALFRGTARYCSVNVHDKKDQSRVDDLWSFVYMLAEMRNPLPWKYIQNRTNVGESKRTTAFQIIFKDCFPEAMIEISTYLKGLDFYARPDYHWIATHFLQIIRENNYKFTDPYDWENSKTLKNTDITMEEITNQKHRPCSASDLREPTNSDESVENIEKPKIVISPENPFPEEYFQMNVLGM